MYLNLVFEGNIYMEVYPSPAEGIGLETDRGVKPPGGSNPSTSSILYLSLYIFYRRGVEQRAKHP